MKKVYQELLKVFLKSNKKKRTEIAKDWGYDTPEALLDFLKKKTSDKPAKEAKSTKEPSSTPRKKTKAPAPKAEVGDIIIKDEGGSIRNEAVTVTTEEEPVNDIVIAFDVTGSMSNYISAVRNHITKLIPELFENMPNLRMEIIAFGDYCDMYNKDSFGYAYQKSGFTNDQKTLINFVNNAQRTGGGDYEEFYELVIKKITEETPWREGSKRSVLLLADATPHPIGYTYRPYVINAQIDWKVEALKAGAMGIKFDTLSMTGEKWYVELSEMTGGVHAPFSKSSNTQEAIYASTLSRGGTKSKALFRAKADAAYFSGDTELAAMYKSFDDKL